MACQSDGCLDPQVQDYSGGSRFFGSRRMFRDTSNYQNIMDTNERLLEITRNFSLLDLPIGVYVVTLDGRILTANKQAREILQLPPEGPIDKSIVDYYDDPTQRELLPKALNEQELKGAHLVSTLTFRIGGREVHVQDHARSITDPETGSGIGYLCCMMDVTSEVRYRKMFDDLPVGVYVLDEHDRIVRVNEAFAKLFGYESPEALEGKPIQEFYSDFEDAREFREALEKKGSLRDYIVQVVKKNEESIFVRVSATKLTSPTGEYAGREGTVMDAAKERYRRIMDIAPIGLYEIQQQGNQDRIVHCNRAFLDINEFDDMREAKQVDVKQLHSSQEEYEQFIQEIESSENALIDRQIRIHTIKGNDKVVRVSIGAVRDKGQKTVGRIGVVRDITEPVHRVEELSNDIGQVLHSFSAALVETKQSTDAIVESMKPNPFAEIVNLLPDDALKEIETKVAQLAQSVDKLQIMASAQERETVLLREKRDDLGRLADIFFHYDRDVPLELQPSVLREAIHQLIAVCDEIKREKLPRELIKQVRSDGQELLRILNLFTLRQIGDLTFAMGHPVRALREFVISGVRPKERPIILKASILVAYAMNNVRDFALNRGVQFKRKIDAPDSLLLVTERDVVRALANILHNAIKYSWSRADNSTPWIMIRLRQVGANVQFEVENYGVPIPKDEIAKELIFDLGFRGRMSSDRGRTGTGVGLADARRVARDHGGEVTAQSHPAISSRRDDDYSHPFLTKVTFILPAYPTRSDG